MAVAVRKRHQDGLVEAAADDLDLTAVHETPHLGDRLRPVGGHPLQQRPGVVQAEVDAGVPLERVEHGRVGVLENVLDDPAEVADGLVVVDDECEGNGSSHRMDSLPGQSAGSRPGSGPRETAMARVMW